MPERTRIGRQHIYTLLAQHPIHRRTVVIYSFDLTLLYIQRRTHRLRWLPLLQMTVPTAVKIDTVALLFSMVL